MTTRRDWNTEAPPDAEPLRALWDALRAAVDAARVVYPAAQPTVRVAATCAWCRVRISSETGDAWHHDAPIPASPWVHTAEPVKLTEPYAP